MPIRPCVTGTEAVNATRLALIRKALALPAVGARATGGIHAAMPGTWDGLGPTPLGWTKDAAVLYVDVAQPTTVTHLDFANEIVTATQQPAAQARLTAGEQGILAGLAAARANVDITPAAFTTLPAATVTMWMSDNSVISLGGTGETNITGYLDGVAVRNLNFDSISQVDIGHGMCVLSDGALVLSHAEISGGNGNEGFLFVPAALTLNNQVFTSPPMRRILCSSFTNVAAHAGARVCAELPNGSILLGRGDWYVRLTRAQLEGTAAHAGAAVFRPAATGGAWDAQADAGGNIWMAGGDEIRLLPAASFPAVGVDSASTTVVTESKRLKGTSVAPANYQIYGMALDSSGGIWAPTSHNTGAGGDDMRYWDSAAIAALTGAPTNPAPTRILTSAAFVNIIALNLDASGGGWVTDFGANKLHYFSAAQLAAGGAQTPQQSVTTSKTKPAFVRYIRGFGQLER